MSAFAKPVAATRLLDVDVVQGDSGQLDALLAARPDAMQTRFASRHPASTPALPGFKPEAPETLQAGLMANARSCQDPARLA